MANLMRPFSLVPVFGDLEKGDKITAKGKHGVLMVTIPKSDKGVTKKITVQD